MRVNYSKAKDLFGLKYAFYKHTRLAVLEKIKNKKKIFREQFYSKAKIFRKNFSTKKIEKRQRRSWCTNRGCVPSAHKAAQYRHVTDISHLYLFAVAATISAYNCETPFCRFRGPSICHGGEIRA